MVNIKWEKFNIVQNGAKLYIMRMKMKERKYDITFVDSINFCPMPLSKFPEAFKLEVDDKGHFPYMANAMDDFILDKLPPRLLW